MSLGPEEKPDEKMEPQQHHLQKTSEPHHQDEDKTALPESSPPPPPPPPADEKAPVLNSDDTSASDVVSADPAVTAPSVQTMPPAGYDPNRIPASIFSTKGAGGDWSTTSNESLFSIHMGNNSFSRDYAILFGKSGELPKLDDQSSQFGELPRLDDWNTSPPSKSYGSLPPVMEESTEFSGKFSDVMVSAENRGKETGVSDVSPARKPPETNYSSLSNPAMSPTARLSDSSVQSGSSFAFPVLAGNDSGKNDLMKVAPEKPEKVEPAAVEQEQPQVSQETATVVSGARWFSCFSWWPRFC